MVRPWAEAGYQCHIVDIQHPQSWVEVSENIYSLRFDIRDGNFTHHLRFASQYHFAFAFPPCTHLAASGARWWKEKGLKSLIEGLTLVERCREIVESLGCPWMLENPIGALATHWRQPDEKFDPCDYGGYLEPEGDAYTKRTCLWTGGGFVMPKPKPVFPIEGSKMHTMSKVPNRANIRSETPMGFARAVFEANAPRINGTVHDGNRRRGVTEGSSGK